VIRATFKSLLSRKLRLTLSGVAVVLGVMFVSGALVLTDTVGRSFEGLFTTIYEYTDIEVSKPSEVTGFTGQATTVPVEQSTVDAVAETSGVTKATGQVLVDGAVVVGKNGKSVGSTGAPRFGGGWTGPSELLGLRSGQEPRSDDEVLLSANLAKTTGYVPGDQIKVRTPFQPNGKTYKVVGIAEYSGGRDSLAGETSVLFTLPEAQQVMLGQANAFSSIDVKVADGANLDQVRDRIATALGSDFDVKTGQQLADDSASGTKQALGFFNNILLGFAGVALFVGMFLILNTFSIIVAQRTRELALFRAMGSSRRQVIGSVLLEAGVVGVLASTIGLALGIGIGAGVGRLAASTLGGGALKLAGLSVPPAAIISAYVVGVGITLVAALLPALRASRIPPVAAMRESATPDRPLTVQSIIGAVVLALGGSALWLGLIGKLGGADLGAVLGGLLVCFVGVALLTPMISKPVVAGVGLIFDFTAAGKLGRANSARNPRRTAITAAALMVSIALVTGISVIFSSIKSSTEDAVTTTVHSDLVIAGDGFTGGLTSFDPQSLDKIRALPGVESAVGLYTDLGKVHDEASPLVAADDLPAALTAFDMKPVAGTLYPLDAGNMLLDDKTAKKWGVSVGDAVGVQMAHTEARSYRLQGIYSGTTINSGPYIPVTDALIGFAVARPIQGFVTVKDGASVDATYTQVDTILHDDPDVVVSKLADFVASRTQIFDFILVFIQMLLGLAMIIAVLGIINTLALSITERTREFGLLRAVGTQRRQVMWMVTVESVVISVFGALLGIAVGAGLGAAVFQALKDVGFTKLSFPWPLMVGYVIASVFVGLIAALVPAIRAARLDVLKAIAYE
jgi:putative ABC transport system permease protein